MEGIKKAAIVIPVYNREDTIEKCVNSALQQDYSLFEVIVVDDGSTDKTSEILKRIEGIKYIRQSNKGPAAARNRGWQSTNADFIFFLDSDCIAPSNWIRKTIEKYSIYQNAGCVGSVYDIANSDCYLAYIIYKEFEIRYSKCSTNTKFIGSFGCCFPRRILELTGGYDSSFPMASHEDNDLGIRILKKGYKLILAKDIKIYHHFPTSFKRYMRTQFWHGYWRMKIVFKYFFTSIQGDDYSNILDYIQPPLAILSAVSGMISLFRKEMIVFTCVCIGILFISQLPISIRYSCFKDRVYYHILCSIRAFFRGIGMIKGIIKFWRFLWIKE